MSEQVTCIVCKDQFEQDYTGLCELCSEPVCHDCDGGDPDNWVCSPCYNGEPRKQAEAMNELVTKILVK